MTKESKTVSSAKKRATGARSPTARQAGLRLYSAVWKRIDAHFLYRDRLSNWQSFQHRFDDKIASQEDGAKYARQVLKLLNEPYTRLFTPDEAAFIRRNSLSSFGGIGADLRILGNGVFIVGKVVKGGPAHKVGLKQDAFILSVDGTSVSKIGPLDLTPMIRGKVGSRLRITAWQEERERRFILRREAIAQSSIDARLLDNGIGYVRISDLMNKATTSRLVASISARLKDCRGLVLDLRGNGGGTTDFALTTMSMFLEEGLLATYNGFGSTADTFIVKLTSDSVTTEWHKRGRLSCTRVHRPELILSRHVPICILIDKETGSNAELIAGTLQDHKRASLLGVKTHGKGIMQRVFKLPGGYLIRVTYSELRTASGHWLGDGHKQRFGLKPDRTVTGSGRIFHSSLARDNQLKAACAYLLQAAEGKVGSKRK